MFKKAIVIMLSLICLVGCTDKGSSTPEEEKKDETYYGLIDGGTYQSKN